MEFSRQGYLSSLPFPTPGDLPDPGLEPVSLSSSALMGRFFTVVPPGKPQMYMYIYIHLQTICSGKSFQILFEVSACVRNIRG